MSHKRTFGEDCKTSECEGECEGERGGFSRCDMREDEGERGLGVLVGSETKTGKTVYSFRYTSGYEDHRGGRVFLKAALMESLSFSI